MNGLVNSVGQDAFSTFSGGMSSFVFIFKSTEECILSLVADFCYPLSALSRPVNASILRGRSGVAGSVLRVFRLIYDAQITPLVVETIPVNVIAFSFVTEHKPEQFSMEQDESTTLAVPHTSDSIAVVVQTPSPLTCPCRVVKIDHDVDRRGVLSIEQWQTNNPGRYHFEGTRGALACHGACGGAEASAPTVDLTGFSYEALGTCFADAWDGTLMGHRASPVLGVTPPAATNSAEALNVKYIKFPRVGAELCSHQQ